MRILGTRPCAAACSTVGPFRLAVFLIVAALFLGCSEHRRTIANLDSKGTTVVCFGDSITAGFGVADGQAFPALLEKNLGMTVINAGVDGDTTADALARMDSDVFPHNPRIVVVQFGGNDFRKKMDRRETFRNFDRIVGRIASRGAMVLLLEFRIGVVRDRYLAGCKRVAKTHGALLVPDFMAGILGNPKLTVDGIHPNAEGHKLIAQRVSESIGPLLRAAEKRQAGKR